MTVYPLLLLFFILAFVFPFFPGVDHSTARKLALLGFTLALIWDSFAYHIREADKNAQER